MVALAEDGCYACTGNEVYPQSSKMAAPAVKTDQDITEKSMPEDDENQNSSSPTAIEEQVPRWGPQHAGAKYLASQYSAG